jgi:integrase
MKPVIGPRLRVADERVQVLTIQQARTIIGTCTSLRDRLLFTILFVTGMRRGQALGLRHSDIDTRARTISITPRSDNENGARAKTPTHRVLPLSIEASRLYLDYMHTEYGDLDSDYVFVNLWGGSRGRALTDASVDDLVRRLRIKSGIEGWSCHTFRHTFATLMRRAGMSIDVISHLLTHADVRTTASVYSHLDVDDLRFELIKAGCWESAA